MLGYQNTNISTILRKLKDFLFTKNKKKYIGDIELGSNILKELQIYREKFLPATLLDSKMDVSESFNQYLHICYIYMYYLLHLVVLDTLIKG